MKLIDYRSRFDSLKNCCHMISNSLGAMPNGAEAALLEYTALWKERGVRAWSDSWWLMAREIGDLIGAIMNAPPDSVTLSPNVTTAQATLLSCFEIKPPRNKVVMVDMEFPSLLYLYRQWTGSSGEVVTIPSDDGITIDAQKIVDAIDDRTLLVPISHVLFRSACIVDIAPIIERAHSVGAQVVLDTYQSLGTVPFDVSALNVDFAVGGCLKWLCGGPGTCFLYTRPDLVNRLTPRFTGWMAHEEPFAFDNSTMRYASGAYRLLSGTPNVPAMFAARPGLEIIDEIGVELIRGRSLEMTQRLLDLAAGHGWPTTAPKQPSQRGGTVAIDVEHGLPIATELNARNFLVDYRPRAGIRLSPHFYNTDDELAAVINEIADIIQSRAYEKHLQTARTVT